MFWLCISLSADLDPCIAITLKVEFSHFFLNNSNFFVTFKFFVRSKTLKRSKTFLKNW
jgi:hypothetical protein